jgi:hypothetical protein
MSGYSNSPKLIKGGAVKRTIALQYNPDTLTRSYQVQGADEKGIAKTIDQLLFFHRGIGGAPESVVDRKYSRITNGFGA